MADSEKDQARRELAHALDALGDGSGQQVWGPGVVGNRLWERNADAALAFDTTSGAVWRVMRYYAHVNGELSDEEKPKFVARIRKLAPVLLELMLDE